MRNAVAVKGNAVNAVENAVLWGFRGRFLSVRSGGEIA
jgi:hypothetical protein